MYFGSSLLFTSSAPSRARARGEKTMFYKFWYVAVRYWSLRTTKEDLMKSGREGKDSGVHVQFGRTGLFQWFHSFLVDYALHTTPRKFRPTTAQLVPAHKD